MIARRHRLSGPILPALVVALAVGCASTSTRDSASTWLEPSPQLELRIEEEATRLPWTHGLERVELIQWFAQVGEPAYPTLLRMVEDPRRDVAGAALAALGATRDARLVEPLRAVPIANGPDGQDLVLERARTLVRLGDWSSLPVLIEGLRDERLMTRALCAQALTESTHERFGYDPRATVEEREASIAKWLEWWQTRSQERILPE